MRAESDKICAEYGLSVIENPGKGKSYAEWKAEQEGRPTIRGQIKEELDEVIKCSYTMKQFWEILSKRGYVICRRRPQYEYTSFIPPYGTKQVRLDKLGPEYTEEAISERIRMGRNGIREFDTPKIDHNDWLKKYEPIKLKGFKALYYHYLYLFGKIRKKETAQRISFYMREELIKFDRYQKQFHFLMDNDIETTEQLTAFKEGAESKIKELTLARSRLYNKLDKKPEIEKINNELRELRKDVRTCNNISADCERIQEHQNYVAQLEQQAQNANKQRFKDKER